MSSSRKTHPEKDDTPEVEILPRGGGRASRAEAEPEGGEDQEQGEEEEVLDADFEAGEDDDDLDDDGLDDDLGDEDLSDDAADDDELEEDPDAGEDRGPARGRRAAARTSGPGRGSPRGKRPVALVPTASRSVTTLDPLQLYIQQVRRYALLTPEQEHELAVRYTEEGDLEAARALVTANLRLVVKIAHEYRKAYRNLLDLIQEGNIGLMHAVKKFDPFRGVKLSSYAAWWIRAYILKFILNNWRLVKIGTTQVQRKLFFNLRKEVERLQAMGIESPGPKLLAERLDVSEEEVTSMQRRLAASDMSLDAPVAGDDAGSATRLEFVAEQRQGPDASVEEAQFKSLLNEKLSEFGKTLTGRDKEIYELRTVADEPLTLQEIGDRYGVTRERARQIERRIMDRLKAYLRAEMGDAVDIALGRGD